VERAVESSLALEAAGAEVIGKNHQTFREIYEKLPSGLEPDSLNSLMPKSQ
jgi:hypothetical protein